MKPRMRCLQNKIAKAETKHILLTKVEATSNNGMVNTMIAQLAGDG